MDQPSQEENLYRELPQRFFVRNPDSEQFYKAKEKIDKPDAAKRFLRNLYTDICDEFEDFDRELVIIFGDFLYNNLIFSLENKFNQQKSCCLIELSANLIYNLFKKQQSKSESFKLFKEMLIRHSLFRPPHSIKIFDLEEVKVISNYIIYSLYKNFNLYNYVYTPNLNYEINTFEMFGSRFPNVEILDEGKQIERKEIQLLDEYMIDKETGLTPEQLEEIMRGDSIHQVPLKKREEWARLKVEREMNRKLEIAIQKEKQRLNKEFEEKIQIQDQNFLEELQTKKK